MANRSTVRTQILTLVSNSTMIAAADVNTIISAEHTSILESYSWSRRRAESVIETSAEYSTGTLSGTGTTYTGSGTTWTSGMVGRFIRAGDNTFFHRITAFGSTTSLTIEDTLPEDVDAGTSYTIFAHRYNLPSDFGRALSVTSDTRLMEMPKIDMDYLDPYRTSTATRPDRYAIFGLDPGTTSSQIYQIEFWPVPSSATAIRLEYLKNNSLTSDSDEPLYRSDILVWKAAEAATYFLHGKTGDAAWLALADRFHQRYADELQSAKEDDIGKYSAVSHVRDTYGLGVRGDDFWLSHDRLQG